LKFKQKIQLKSVIHFASILPRFYSDSYVATLVLQRCWYHRVPNFGLQRNTPHTSS